MILLGGAWWMGYPGGPDGKESACKASSFPGLGRSPGGGHGHSSILAWRISMDRGAWWAAGYGVTESRTWLSGSAQHSLLSILFLSADCGQGWSGSSVRNICHEEWGFHAGRGSRKLTWAREGLSGLLNSRGRTFWTNSPSKQWSLVIGWKTW